MIASSDMAQALEGLGLFLAEETKYNDQARRTEKWVNPNTGVCVHFGDRDHSITCWITLEIQGRVNYLLSENHVLAESPVLLGSLASDFIISTGKMLNELRRG